MDIIIALVFGFAIGYFWGQRMGRTKEALGERNEKILKLLDTKGTISNEDVEAALGVSDATATRILDELEKSGHLVQVGTTGQGVTYRRK